MLGNHRRDLCFRCEMWSFMCAQRQSIEIHNSVLCTELPLSSKKTGVGACNGFCSMSVGSRLGLTPEPSTSLVLSTQDKMP